MGIHMKSCKKCVWNDQCGDEVCEYYDPVDMEVDEMIDKKRQEYYRDYVNVLLEDGLVDDELGYIDFGD
jgi:hypothetical protein